MVKPHPLTWGEFKKVIGSIEADNSTAVFLLDSGNRKIPVVDIARGMASVAIVGERAKASKKNKR